MKRFLALLAATSLLLTACGYSPPADSQDSPEKVVEAFYDALINHGDKAAKQFIDPDTLGTAAWDIFWQNHTDFPTTGITVTSVGNNYVYTTVEFDMGDLPASGTSGAAVIELNGKWFITSIP